MFIYFNFLNTSSDCIIPDMSATVTSYIIQIICSNLAWILQQYKFAITTLIYIFLMLFFIPLFMLLLFVMI
jgi:hypothetical protein